MARLLHEATIKHATHQHLSGSSLQSSKARALFVASIESVELYNAFNIIFSCLGGTMIQPFAGR